MTFNRCIFGEALAVLRTLPSDTFHCCATSPPYWGLRDYGTGTWWGGDPECDHVAGKARGDQARETPGGRGGSFRGGTRLFVGTCAKCGADRVDDQLGQEPTPMEYVERLVSIFAEVRRVLRPDGTLWLNIGDSYASPPSGKCNGNAMRRSTLGGGKATGERAHAATERISRLAPGLKPKDLVGIPWAVAFALRDAGWWLRGDIIWSKPNPMPESVQDRPTKAHEYVFLLSKSETYSYDADAIRESHAHPELARSWPVLHNAERSSDYQRDSVRNDGGRHISGLGFRSDPDAGRNCRSVWTIATQPYDGAHFATMPPKLAERCILAGCPVGGIVLDPFFGSGTTGQVAEGLGRRWLGIELNEKYAPLIAERTAQAGLFGREAAQ